MHLRIPERLAQAVALSARRGRLTPEEWVRRVLEDAVIVEPWEREAHERDWAGRFPESEVSDSRAAHEGGAAEN